MHFKSFRGGIAVALILLSLAGCDLIEKNDGIDYGLLNPSRDFSLKDQDRHIFNLRDHRGEIVLLFFGYTSCPDICPGTLSKLSRVYKLLESNKLKILTLFVSVDPERDTPEKLKEYLGYFSINAVGLTGTKEEIDAVVSAYKASYEKVNSNSAMGYLFNHSDSLYLIDAEGRTKYLFHTEDKAEKIADRIKRL